VKLKLIIVLIFFYTSAKAQNYYLDTLVQMKYQHGISADLLIINRGVGLVYNYNFWSGLGYRNYNSLSGGFSRQYLGNNNSKNNFGLEMGIWHHHRFGLKKLVFFTVGATYKPFFNLSQSTDKEHDSFIHYGNLMIGLNGIRKRVHFEFLAGPSIIEAKQDLYTSVHTYAQILFEVKFRLGIFFYKKKED